MGVRLIGVVNKTQLLQRSWTLSNDSKHNEASFMTISTDSLRLRVAQTPRSRDLAIFVLTIAQQGVKQLSVVSTKIAISRRLGTRLASTWHKILSLVVTRPRD
jgi:hypothetical protein